MSITPPNVNRIAYNTFKNEVLTRGEKSNVGSDYNIYYRPSSSYAMLFSYEPTNNFLSIYFSHEKNGTKTTVSLFLYEDMNPAILYTIKFSPGEEYKMHADFPKATYPYVVTSTTIPDNLSSDTAELLNTVLSLMDVETQSQIGISFSDFGIFYKKD